MTLLLYYYGGGFMTQLLLALSLLICSTNLNAQNNSEEFDDAIANTQRIPLALQQNHGQPYRFETDRHGIESHVDHCSNQIYDAGEVGYCTCYSRVEGKESLAHFSCKSQASSGGEALCACCSSARNQSHVHCCCNASDRPGAVAGE